MNKDLKIILITEEQLAKRAKEIGNQITQKYQDKEIVILGLLKGAYVFVSDIARHVNNPNLSVEFIVVSSYKNGSSTREVKIVLDLKRSIKDKVVIIVEDIVDTGRTLSNVKEILMLRGAKRVEIASMCTKPSRREQVVDLDYPSFEIPNEIVVGYGLDYNEYYRHLPYVASITEEFQKNKKIK